MQPPNDKTIYEGVIADYWLEDGMLVSLSKLPKRTVALIRDNVQLVQSITGNKPMPLLIYLCNYPMPDKETRALSTEQLPKIYTAMAMVSKGGLAQFIMNLLFRFKQRPIPMKSFSNDADAKAWLKQFVSSEAKQ
ncbi:MAG: STAS/SEC14 domain-containing protein [Chitinophagaceae bacterium]